MTRFYAFLAHFKSYLTHFNGKNFKTQFCFAFLNTIIRVKNISVKIVLKIQNYRILTLTEILRLYFESVLRIFKYIIKIFNFHNLNPIKFVYFLFSVNSKIFRFLVSGALYIYYSEKSDKIITNRKRAILKFGNYPNLIFRRTERCFYHHCL